jgi:hypothetical protein
MSVELAGERMTIREEGEKTIFTFDDKGTGRGCGGCTLCCKLVPVPTIGKEAGKKCQNQRHGKGCTIYANRPFACRSWSCRWLADPETQGMSRPDRAHYVIDCTWDYITLRPEDGSAPTNLAVIQVWVDPAFRDAYKAPELRAYMERVAIKHRAACIVRWSRNEAIVVFAPCLNSEGVWHEQGGQVVNRTDKERHEAMMLGEEP